jgi:hypothetical protein
MLSCICRSNRAHSRHRSQRGAIDKPERTMTAVERGPEISTADGGGRDRSAAWCVRPDGDRGARGRLWRHRHQPSLHLQESGCGHRSMSCACCSTPRRTTRPFAHDGSKEIGADARPDPEATPQKVDDRLENGGTRNKATTKSTISARRSHSSIECYGICRDFLGLTLTANPQSLG